MKKDHDIPSADESTRSMDKTSPNRFEEGTQLDLMFPLDEYERLLTRYSREHFEAHHQCLPLKMDPEKAKKQEEDFRRRINEIRGQKGLL